MEQHIHETKEREVDLNGVQVLLTSQLDRYQSRGRWGDAEQEVEIWEVADGRVIRLSRMLNSSSPWTATLWV